MPYVCAPGRGQVDGQCSALREKEEAPSCTCSLQQLRAPPLSVTHPLSVTTWTGIPRWRAIRAVATIVVHCATPSPPMPGIMSGIIFGETSFDCYTIWFDAPGFLPLRFLSDSAAFRKRVKTDGDGATEMDFLACQSRTIGDRIAWQFTQPAF